MVVPGSIRHAGDELDFRISDRDGSHPIPVSYTGEVPDPFRDGREVIVTGKLQDGTFIGQRDSLVTKCPSKFTTTTPEQLSCPSSAPHCWPQPCSPLSTRRWRRYTEDAPVTAAGRSPRGGRCTRWQDCSPPRS